MYMKGYISQLTCLRYRKLSQVEAFTLITQYPDYSPQYLPTRIHIKSQLSAERLGVQFIKHILFVLIKINFLAGKLRCSR